MRNGSVVRLILKRPQLNDLTSKIQPFGIPQGSILGPLIFLLYFNDMPRAVDCDLLLYADDSCLVFSGNDINEIEMQLNTYVNFHFRHQDPG